MFALTIAVHVVSALTALLAVYYTVRDLRSDLVLLGAGLFTTLIWGAEFAALLVRDLAGGDVRDPVTLYGYLLTGLALPIGGAYVSLLERSRWGSFAIGVAAATLMVLQLRVEQIWPGGFA